MIAKEIISPNIPAILCSDTGKKALEIMETYRVSHLALLRNGEYIGLLTEKNLYDFQLEASCLGERGLPLLAPFVFENQHIYEVAQTMFDIGASLLPVLNLNNEYLGSISLTDLSVNLTRLVSVNVPGGVVVVEVNPNDYVLSQIAHLVESNNAKILSLYVKSNELTGSMDVTMKLNATDLSPIIQTFVRYDYNIKAVYMEGSMFKDMYADRYDHLMKYINI